MDFADYTRDLNDGDPCARPGCPGRATTYNQDGTPRLFCCRSCADLVREYERNRDWQRLAAESGRTESIEAARAQQELLDQLSELLSQFRNTRRPAQHRNYLSQCKNRELQRRSNSLRAVDDKRQATLDAIERLRAAGQLGKQTRYVL